MKQLFEVLQKLTEEERRTVQDFAEFLLSRRAGKSTGAERSAADRRISFDGWAGCLAHVDPEKSDKQLMREAWDDFMKKWDR